MAIGIRQMKKTLLLSLILYTICQSSVLHASQKKYIQKMKWLYSANPEKDYKNALKHKDYRFIGINGYSLYVPGLKIDCLNTEKDINTIQGTADTTVDNTHAQLNKIAIEYAKDYNLRMKHYREKYQGFKCEL
jgi:hypothetical protein